MITFLVSLVALVLGYLLYGRFVEKTFGPDNRVTPAVEKADGVDFLVLPSWKIFMIQFLNIAGTGPIFGAIMGAMFGPAAYLWIVLGCIFAGSVHDYFSGMLSMRHGGANQPEIIGSYLGNTTKQVMLVFTVFLLMMVGTVFVFSPAKILGDMWEPAAVVESAGQYTFWIIVIFIYYIIATMLPIDKIIGKIYPLFAFSLLFMAAALTVVLFVKWPAIPEIWEGLSTEALTPKNIFPCLFITIACGAISGFHATQSPLMARCLKSEKMGRPIFYGAMITEGVVALIWATVAMYFFYNDPTPGYQLVAGGEAVVKDAPSIVNVICNDWLGVFGGILALLGVVAAPITSGDTALPTDHCRLRRIGAENYPQTPVYLYSTVCRCHCLAHLADVRQGGLRQDLELVRLEQPDTLCIYAVGCHGVSGSSEETIHHHAHSSNLHDHRLHHVPAERASVQPHIPVCAHHRCCNGCRGCSMVYALVSKRKTNK